MSKSSFRARMQQALHRLGKALPSRQSAQAQPIHKPSASHTEKIAGQRLMFGMRWQPLSADANLAQELSKHKAQGAKAYVVSVASDLLGLSDAAPPKGTFSAALALAEQHSQGGSELFLFQFKQDHALIALNQGLPVPGFDLWGSQQAITDAAKLFTDIHGAQRVRSMGNVQGWPGIEPLSPDTAFADPAEYAQVSAFQSLRQWLPVVLLAVLLGLAYAAYAWYEAEQEAERLARSAPEDPNVVYERKLRAALQALAPSGMGAVQAWSDALSRQPLQLAGWTLSQAKCRAEVCQLTWQRVYGNYLDFFNAAQTQLGVKAEVETSKGLKDAGVTTAHPTDLSSVTRLERQNLPMTTEARKTLGAQLQDLLLVGASQVVVTDPTLFGEPGGGLAGLRKPVLRGEFRIEGPLWMLKELALPAFAVPEGIELNFLPNKGAELTQRVPTKFVLTGGYFANGSKQ